MVIILLKYKKRIIKLTALFFIMAVIWQLLTFILTYNSPMGEFHIRGFFREPENSLDTVLIGCSELYADYSPPIAYKENGFTSYNLCYAGTPSFLYPDMLDEVMKRQTPDLVVFEVNGFFYKKDNPKRDSKLRIWLDSLPRTPSRAEAILKYCEPDEYADHFLTIFKYHDNWKHPLKVGFRVTALADNYINEDVSLMKSFGTWTSNESQTAVRVVKEPKLTSFGRQQLEKTIEHCHELGIKNVLFIRTPHRSKLDERSDKKLRKTITEGGYDYINFDDLTDEIGLDLENDFYNREHMNVIGCEKFTKYLGDYITTHYDIGTSHDQKVTGLWKRCAEYTESTFGILKQRTLENEDLQYNEFIDPNGVIHKIRLKYSDHIKVDE